MSPLTVVWWGFIAIASGFGLSVAIPLALGGNREAVYIAPILAVLFLAAVVRLAGGGK